MVRYDRVLVSMLLTRFLALEVECQAFSGSRRNVLSPLYDEASFFACGPARPISLH